MTPNEHDPLIRQLLELVKELDSEDIPIILGGGMSLYLRQRFLRIPANPRTVSV
jgi:methylmalonyl-CoA mutase cobalamin-binding subunit